jgi:hypothetical protein
MFTETARANLVATNAGFELGVVNGTLSNVPGWGAWSYRTNGTVVADASMAHGGTNYLMLGSVGRFCINVDQRFSLTNEAGQVVQARGWMRASPTNTILEGAQAWLQLIIHRQIRKQRRQSLQSQSMDDSHQGFWNQLGGIGHSAPFWYPQTLNRDM